MISVRAIFFILLAGFLISCNLDLNAPDNGNETDPDSTNLFQNSTSSHLPSTLGGISQKAKAADIDNDGDPDVIIAVQRLANKILINNGSGAFSDESNDRLPSQSFDSEDIAIADFNGDSDLDLFFVGSQDDSDEHYINEDGNFSDLSNRIPTAGNSTAAEALDIDGEGTIDIMIGNTGQNRIFLNNGNFSFNDRTTQRLPQIADATQDIEFGDITGDNLRDIVIGNEDNNRILINISSGFFEDQTTDRIPFIDAVEATQDVEIVDVNGDGDPDLYFGNSSTQEDSNPQDRLLINDGDGFYTDETTNRLPAISTNTSDAEFADLDIDGNPDLVIANSEGGLRVLINDGSGVFTDETGAWIPDGFNFRISDIEIADFNNDQYLDLYLTVSNSQDQLLLQRND